MTPVPTLPPHFEIVKDAAAAAERTADLFIDIVVAAVRERGRAFVCLAGGSTPRAAYTLLASEPRRRQVDWNRLVLFFGDERCVPPDDLDSNFKMVEETLLTRVLFPWTQVHRIRGEDDPVKAAEEYAKRMGIVFASSSIPRFDLVLLGMGPDGHTASLFPGTPALDERDRWAVANLRPEGRMGVTLTFPVFNAARSILLTVTGAGKAPALRRVLADEPNPLPAGRIRPADGTLTWIVDEELVSAVNSPS